MYLWLTEAQAQQIIDQCIRDIPNESCGIIAGRANKALEILPIPNASKSPAKSYVLEPQAFVQAMFHIERTGLDLLGIYHSHPQGKAIPSPTDIASANYPEAAYVIVGLGATEHKIAAWHIQNTDVMPVELHVGDYLPEAINSDESLSLAQQTAIIISGVLAFIFVLITALSLLPPAPVSP